MARRIHIARKLFIMQCLLLMLGKAVYCQADDALALAGKVADKVILDTRFAFRWVPWQQELGMQVIDCRFLPAGDNQYVYALSYAATSEDTTVHFGINSSAKIKIWLNREAVYTQDEYDKANPAEIAYGRFRFAHQFKARMRKGHNELLIRYEGGPGKPLVFLKPLNSNGDLDSSLRFKTDPSWLFAGPFPAEIKTGLPEQDIRPYYETEGRMINWQSAPQRLLPELMVDSHAAYRRDSYADWQYSHGIMVWSILSLGEAANETRYNEFVKKYTGFILQHLDYFHWQYDSLFAWRGSYHRIFRQSMLDDAGAPALPFTALYLKEKDTAFKKIIDPAIDYVSRRQVRLADGTFCRPEPVEFTVWADDLFMSVPLLLQAAKICVEKKYDDDAAQQAIHFHQYLSDRGTGLYRHGWFSNTKTQSPVFWGRANGWIAWATAELLSALPVNHPLYKTILNNFRKHIAGVLKYQSADGMWRQVLDNPGSYEETSCTAMFVLAMARGLRMGWLNDTYKPAVQKGWKALAARIGNDGIVHGICRGTEIGPDQQFYINRKTIDNDPRGLGAVITACIEMSKLRSIQ